MLVQLLMQIAFFFAMIIQIADYFVSDGDRPEEFAIGLHEDLNAVEGHDIGQFPGLDTQTPQVAEAQLTPSI
jgi:hypothetical protein